jgi:phosphinothricin acetyltransferase
VIGDSAQTPSIRLHAACGFEMVGTLKSIGFKFGRWLDGVLMQRALGPGDTLPPTDSSSTANTGTRSLKDVVLTENPRGEFDMPSRCTS